MRKYEAMLIVPASLDDAEVQKVADKFKDVIEKGGGTVESAAKWDTRKLAYEIKGHKDGTYIQINFEANPATQAELRRQLSISDQIIRNRVFLLED
jgi:small subunit ribosomal protein S6